MTEHWLALEKTIDVDKFKNDMMGFLHDDKNLFNEVLFILESCRKPLNISVLAADNKYFKPQDIESITNNGELIQVNLKKDESRITFDAKRVKPEIGETVIARGDTPSFIAEARWDGRQWWRNNNGYGFTVSFNVTEWWK